MRFRGGEDELGMLRWFFEGLQQRVEGTGREHVNFVDDKNLEARFVRQVADVFAELANIIDAGIRGAIDFNDVEALAGGNLCAGGTLAARLI